MGKKTDVCVVGAEVTFLPVETRVPLKFGPETLTHVTCARVRMRVEDKRGKTADGWGETPLSVQWAWPSELSYEERHEAMQKLCLMLAESWSKFACGGHPLEIGWSFVEKKLPMVLKKLNRKRSKKARMPWLAALISCSAFDVACHDAYGNLLGKPVYETYSGKYMNRDLSHYLRPAKGAKVKFGKTYPCDFFVKDLPRQMPAWHLVGGKDLLEKGELTGQEPADGYPVLLPDWIERDGLTCLKVKLRGNDAKWDYDRLVQVGEIAIKGGVLWLTSDFNCTVTDPDYVNGILDRLLEEQPRMYGMILYVEQPFPYDLEKNQIDVHSVSARKPLFMDESAHDWKFVRMGRELGWTGVALKTCKTQSGALLSMCWAKAHGMTLMVQDLTNPMLAQVPHVLLAAYSGTIMGVETNAMQFYPEASKAEEAVHPGLYKRKKGMVDLSTVKGPGFGYCLDKIKRDLPEPAGAAGHID